VADPTRAEVDAAVDQVWAEVFELAATPEGVALMVEALEAAEGHDE
jgi:hypothetical protein